MKTVEEIQESFLSMPFFSHIGFEIIHFREGDVLLKLSMQEELLNANGTLHGGVHATMLDFILGMVLRSKTKTRCVTTSLNVNYLAPSSKGDIFASGVILQQGYKTAVVEGQLVDGEGKLLVKGVGSFKLIRD